MRIIASVLLVCIIFLSQSPMKVSAEGEVPELPPLVEPDPSPGSSPLQEEGDTQEQLLENYDVGSHAPLASALEAGTITFVDPWFACIDDTVDGVVDGFCQYLSVQAAVNDFTARQGSGIIMIEPGNFIEDVTINNIPQLSGLEGINPFTLSQITGNVSIQNQVGFSLANLFIQGAVHISNSSGSLVINNVNVSNSAGNGVEIIDHSGDVSLDTVNLSNNTGYGLRIRTASGAISIRNSVLNNNLTGASLLSQEYISIDSSSMNDNSQVGLEILNAASVFINGSDFSKNKGTGVAGAGILASGQVTINNVTANQNTGDGIILFTSQGDILIMNSSFNSNGMYGLRAFWPEYYTFTAERVESCYNRIGSYWLFGSERSGSIETCGFNDGQPGTSLNELVQMRTLILDSRTPSGTFFTDLPTQVLVQDDQAAPPVTLARLVFPLFSNPLADITVTSLAKNDPLVVPALETDWLAPGIRVTISSTGDSELQTAPAFSVCFTTSSANSTIAYLGEGGNSWVELESQHSGDQVCAASNKPGIFVLVDSIP